MNPTQAAQSVVLTEADLASARINNQFTQRNLTSGVLDAGGRSVIFLEYMSGTGLQVLDKDGNALTGSGISALDFTHSPLRINQKMTISGTINTVKGFVVRK